MVKNFSSITFHYQNVGPAGTYQKKYFSVQNNLFVSSPRPHGNQTKKIFSPKNIFCSTCRKPVLPVPTIPLKGAAACERNLKTCDYIFSSFYEIQSDEPKNFSFLSFRFPFMENTHPIHFKRLFIGVEMRFWKIYFSVVLCFLSDTAGGDSKSRVH